MADWRGFLKRVAYAGLGPQGAAKLPLRERLRRRLEQFGDRLAGVPPREEGFTGGRTWKQNVRVAVLVALPVLVIGGLLFWRSRATRPADAQEGPVVPSSLAIDLRREGLRPSEVEVAEIVLMKDAQPPVARGTVRNHSGEKPASVEISFNVTNKDGMLLGAVTTAVRDIPPHGSQTFEVEIPQKDAAIVIVRDTRRL
jgi:hypothetical protein